jgi:alpha-1,2-mannosyltransferase
VFSDAPFCRELRCLPVAVCLVMLGWFGWVDPIPHYDVDVFLRAAASVGRGGNPYPRPGTAAVYSGSAFVYPYLVAWLFTPLNLIPRATAADAFILVSAVALIAGARLLGVRRPAEYALVGTMSCTIVGLQMGTLNALLFLGVAALWRFRDRPLVTVAILATIIVSKLFLFPLCAWPLFTRRPRTAVAAAALTVALLAVGWIAGPLSAGGYSALLASLGTHEAAAGLSTTGLLVNMGIPMAAAQAVSRMAAVAIILATGTRARRAGDQRVLFTGCLVAALVWSPVVWSHYLILLMIPLLIESGDTEAGEIRAGNTAAGPPRTAIAVAVAYSWLVVWPHHTSALSVVLGVTLVGVLAGPTLLAAAFDVVAGRSARPRRPRAARLATLGGPLIAAALVGGLAAAHGRAGAVVGAGCAQLAMAVVLRRGWRQAGGPPRHLSARLTARATPREPYPAGPASADLAKPVRLGPGLTGRAWRGRWRRRASRCG